MVVVKTHIFSFQPVALCDWQISKSRNAKSVNLPGKLISGIKDIVLKKLHIRLGSMVSFFKFSIAKDVQHRWPTQRVLNEILRKFLAEDKGFAG